MQTLPSETDSHSVDETRRLSEQVWQYCRQNGIRLILLEGSPGAGKTVFSQGLARSFGIEGIVNSPSFSIYNIYDAPGGRLVHVDLYRLHSDELHELGLDELYESCGLFICEWWQRGRSYFEPWQNEALLVKIDLLPADGQAAAAGPGSEESEIDFNEHEGRHFTISRPGKELFTARGDDEKSQ